jgi:hypothetical protein
MGVCSVASVDHDVAMTRSLKVIFAVGSLLVAAALAGFVVFLRRQGLTQAGSWVTVVGFFTSTVLGLAGVVFGWLAWRHPISAPAGPSTPTVGRSGRIKQHNTGGVNVANTGVMGEVRPPGDGL